MGISDDIRPKKYRPISKPKKKAEVKIAKEVIEELDSGQLFSNSYDGDFFGGTPIEHDYQKKQSTQRKGHRWIYILFIAIAIAALVGLVVWQNYPTIKSYIDGSYKEKNNKSLSEIISSTNDSTTNYDNASQDTKQSTASTQTVTQPTTAINKSTIAISVLNGSGIKSSAANVSTILKAAGFNVIDTANAKSFNYQKTYIYYKTGDEAKANLVKETLTEKDTETSLNDTLVGSKYDIVVVVGKS